MDKQDKTADDFYQSIETMMFSAFLQGRDGEGFKQWYDKNSFKERFTSLFEHRTAELEAKIKELEDENNALNSDIRSYRNGHEENAKRYADALSKIQALEERLEAADDLIEYFINTPLISMIAKIDYLKVLQDKLKNYQSLKQ